MHTFRTPVFFDADDGAGSGEVIAPGADQSLGTPSPDEQSFDSAKDFRSARQALLREPPVVLHDDSPAPPAEPAATDDAALLDELASTPPAGGPETGAPAQGTAPPADPYAAFGGEEAVRNAHAVAEALRTEQGIKGMVGQGLIALGYSPEAIQAFVDANRPGLGGQAQQPGAAPAPPEPVDPFAGIEDGEIVTGADLKAALQTVRDEAARSAAAATQAATQPLEQTIQQQQLAQEQREQAYIQQVATGTYQELLGQPPVDPEGLKRYGAQAARIQQLAESVVVQGSKDPAEIRRAIIAGHALFVDEMEQAFRGYAAGKKAAAADLPTNIGGGSPPGGEPVKEPVNLSDARKQAKAAGFFK